MDSKRQSVAPTPPSSKRQRIDSDPPPNNSQVEDSLSSLSPTSHLSSPEPESNLPSKSNSNNGEDIEDVEIEAEEEEEDDDEEEEEEGEEEEEEEVDDTGNNNSSEVGGDEGPPAGEDGGEEEGEEEVEDEELTRHHELSAKTLPSHQPGPADIVLNGNGNGSSNNRATVGGKGKRGEEALEHAVAAREEVERRREENRQERMQQGSKSGLPPPGGAASLLAAKATLMGLVANGAQNVKVKVEEEEPVVVAEVEDEDDDLGPPLKRERPALQEERDNIIRFVVVTNDGTPSSLIILTGLKNIFQKQLPKMPREYIARLVYDRNHYSMAIVKRGLEVVGGITYRPFEARKFAEIVFCAITGTEQVKGYGSHLMNHLKDYVKMSTACMHFLTYADNYAIGYFKKQGFTKEVGLDRSVWAGYIKDYEGGTIMHCSMLEVIKYLDAAAILAKQKEVILGEIRLLSRSHIIHPGLSLFSTLPQDGSLDPSQVPGLKESGWTPEMDDLTRRPKRGPQFAIMQRLLTLLNDHPSAWAFANPVNAGEVTDYYEVIKEPMDLATMDRKLETNTYTSLVEFTDDAKRIFNNCRAYNDPGSNYVKNANKLELYLAEQVKLFDQ